MELREVFEECNFLRCLDAYDRFAVKANWPIREHFDLYGHAKAASDPNLETESRRYHFSRWYGAVVSWPGYARGGGVLPAPEAFDLLERCQDGISRSSGLTLLDMSSADHRGGVTRALPEFWPLKTNASYPWMAASKILHFVNPRLFPIYDDQFVWQTAMWQENGGRRATFRADYETFCRERRYNPKENGAQFLSDNYMEWAATALAEADHGFMATFAKWYKNQVAGAPDTYGVLDEIHTYHAVAFEYAVLGATTL